MKIDGLNLGTAHQVVLVLPREGEQDIVLKFQAVLDLKKFDADFPEPSPGYIRRPGDKQATKNYEDPAYKKKIQAHSSARIKWILLKSIEATPGLTWEKVKLGDMSTWDKIDEELQDAGFNPAEISRIYNAMMAVNSLDDALVKEARERFFASRTEGEKVAT